MPDGDYPSDWDRIRREIYKRDGYCCRNCYVAKGGRGGTSRVECHHIDPDGEAIDSNLETLCEYCHGERHPHLKAARLLREKKSKVQQLKLFEDEPDNNKKTHKD